MGKNNHSFKDPAEFKTAASVNQGDQIGDYLRENFYDVPKDL